MDLIKIRLVSFAYEACTFFIGIFATAIASDEFRAILEQHFGTSVGGTLALLVLTGVVKHLRNRGLVDKEFGGTRDADQVLI